MAFELKDRNLINDFKQNLEQFSEEEDQKGILEGDFMMEDGILDFMAEHSKLIKKMILQRKELQRLVGDSPQISVLYFKNKSKTVKRILFYVKPITRFEIMNVVKACNKLQIKVSYITCIPHA